MQARLGVLTLTVVTLTACATGQSGREINDQYRAELELANQEYRLRPGDTVRIQFPGAEQYNQESLLIREDGRISTPFGRFAIAGLTIPAAEELIWRTQEVLEAPVVSLQVITSNPLYVWVAGEVTRAGAVRYSRNMTALEALMEAGGNTETGNTWNTLLVRHAGMGKAAVHRVNLRDFENPLLLLPRDILYVTRTNIARVNLWVEQFIRNALPINPSLAAL